MVRDANLHVRWSGVNALARKKATDELNTITRFSDYQTEVWLDSTSGPDRYLADKELQNREAAES